jgi:hypothetical protein
MPSEMDPVLSPHQLSATGIVQPLLYASALLAPLALTVFHFHHLEEAQEKVKGWAIIAFVVGLVAAGLWKPTREEACIYHRRGDVFVTPVFAPSVQLPSGLRTPSSLAAASSSASPAPVGSEEDCNNWAGMTMGGTIASIVVPVPNSSVQTFSLPLNEPRELVHLDGGKYVPESWRLDITPDILAIVASVLIIVWAERQRQKGAES